MKHRVWRRVLSVVLTVCLLLTLLPSTAWAFFDIDDLGDIGEPWGEATYILNDGLTATTYMDTTGGAMKLSLVIHRTDPEDTGSYAMPNYSSAAEVHWADNANMISAVYIQEGVTSVGNYAFSGMTNLTEVDLPTTVTRIGDYAFQGDSRLASPLSLSDVTEIGAYAFSGCSQLPFESLDLSGLTSLGERAFQNCSRLTGVTLPTDSGFGAIPAYAFSGTGLTSINIPSNIKTVGERAFSGTGLTNIVLQGAEAIGNYAFYNTPVQTLFLPDTLTSIGASAFERSLSAADTPLTSLTIPESVTSIGNRAFFNHKNLETVAIEGTRWPRKTPSATPPSATASPTPTRSTSTTRIMRALKSSSAPFFRRMTRYSLCWKMGPGRSVIWVRPVPSGWTARSPIPPLASTRVRMSIPTTILGTKKNWWRP